jgi:choline dehydrogenase
LSSRSSLGVIELISELVNFINPKGRRVTAENSYLTSEVLKRPNLRVITSATVTKVIFDRTGGQPRAVGVEFTSSRDGPRFIARAEKEVILW